MEDVASKMARKEAAVAKRHEEAGNERAIRKLHAEQKRLQHEEVRLGRAASRHEINIDACFFVGIPGMPTLPRSSLGRASASRGFDCRT